MKKTLSILKPHIRHAVMDNEVMEKISYLDIPSELDLKKLRSDVKMGAVQFAELDELLVKENEPQYILISANNLEQGYLAVTYLASGFNRKHGADVYDEPDGCDEEAQAGLAEWKESPSRIPLIEEHELHQTLSRGNDHDIFSVNDMFMQGGQNRLFHTPYWMNCTHDSVCIISRDHDLRYGNGFPAPYAESDAAELGLNHFRGNDKIYILRVNPWMTFDGGREEEEGREECTIEISRGKWNRLVLCFSADEVSVCMKKETEKKYYKLLLQGNFAAKGLSVKKGLSYERLVNIVAAMDEVNKCRLVENIVRYAVKDWKSADERPIENRDFDFMDRFCRAYHAERGKGRKHRTARERMMQELVGMEDVKKQVLNVINVMKYNQIRARMGIWGGGYHNVHVMLGAPGTAKTTVAHLMGQIMAEERLLPDDRFICVNGAELKGMYVGHSAPKTKALFEDNDIIVIDEAYSLAGDCGENDSFAKEALAQLIIELEEHSTDKLVIFAGYGGPKVSDKNNKMKDFLDANPGIRSRITSTIYFDSYSADEMVQIFFKIAENSHYRLDESGRAESIRKMLRDYFQNHVRDDDFGNGREARRLLETAVVHTAERVLAQDKKVYTRAEMQTIGYEDVEKAVKQSEYAGRIRNAGRMQGPIGF